MLVDADVVSDDVTVLDTVLIIGIVTVTTVPVLCDFETDVEVIMTPGMEVAVVARVSVIIINDVSVVVVVTGGCDSVSVTSVVTVVYVVVISVVTAAVVNSGSSSDTKLYPYFSA